MEHDHCLKLTVVVTHHSPLLKLFHILGAHYRLYNFMHGMFCA